MVEEFEVGRGASWAGGGILSPLKPWRYSQWHENLTTYSLQCLDDLTQELSLRGCFFERNRTGMLYCNENLSSSLVSWLERYPNVQLLRNEKLHQWLYDRSFSQEWIQQTQTGIWMPSVDNVRNPRLLKALRDYLLTCSNFRLQEHVKAKLLYGLTKHKKHGVTGVELTSVLPEIQEVQFVPSSAVVVCAGAWTTLLFQEEVTRQVKPIRGEMLLYRPKSTLQTMVMQGSHYLIPRADGLVLAGSTVEDAGYSCETTVAGKLTLQKFASSILPELSQLEPLRHWAGLRPALVGSEGIPYLGPVKNVAGLWVNTGHYRNGIVHGPGAAKLLVDTMHGIRTHIPLAPEQIQSRSYNLVE